MSIALSTAELAPALIECPACDGDGEIVTGPRCTEPECPGCEAEECDACDGRGYVTLADARAIARAIERCA